MGKKLGLILPVYNGSSLLQQHIPSIQEYIDQLSIYYEIIVVDDGSEDKDETLAVAREFGCKF
jgi:glycosyltransferase involved in cell wall biosynthesis